MTTRRIFTRSVATFTAMLALATGITLTAAPSTARAETTGQLIDDPFFFDTNLDDEPAFDDVEAEPQHASSRTLRGVPTTGRPVPGPFTTVPSTPSTGIIMRDGGVCDPIRHMGC